MFTQNIAYAMVVGGGIGALLGCGKSLLRENYKKWRVGALLVFPLAICLFPISMYQKRHEINGDWKISFIPVTILFVGLALVTWVYSDFFDREIDYIKSEIANEYHRRGVDLVEVEMIRDGHGKLTGLVNLGSGGFSLSRKCSAIKSGRDQKLLWSCD